MTELVLNDAPDDLKENVAKYQEITEQLNRKNADIKAKKSEIDDIKEEISALSEDSTKLVTSILKKMKDMGVTTLNTTHGKLVIEEKEIKGAVSKSMIDEAIKQNVSSQVAEKIASDAKSKVQTTVKVSLKTKKDKPRSVVI